MIFKKFFKKFKDKKGGIPFGDIIFISTLVILTLIFIITFIVPVNNSAQRTGTKVLEEMQSLESVLAP